MILAIFYMLYSRKTDLGPLKKELLLGSKAFGICCFPFKQVEKIRPSSPAFAAERPWSPGGQYKLSCLLAGRLDFNALVFDCLLELKAFRRASEVSPMNAKRPMPADCSKSAETKLPILCVWQLMPGRVTVADKSSFSTYSC